jgi:hypothetical protein
MAIDPKHLPEDPKVLRQIVLDLMAQLERECTERNKIETMLRELLDARRNRKSEQLSADQLALFAAAWQARQAKEKQQRKPMTPMTTAPRPTEVSRLRRSDPAVASRFRAI